MKYGPQTEQIEALIERAKNLTEDEADRLNATQEKTWNDHWDAVLNAAWDTSWDAALDAVRDAALEDVWDTVRDAALEDVWDALLALLVKDKISEKDFNTLYGPWASVMEDSKKP